MFGTLFKAVKGVFGWITDKSKAKHEIKMAEFKAVEKQQEHLSGWELQQLKDKNTGMRWVILITICFPVWMAFIGVFLKIPSLHEAFNDIRLIPHAYLDTFLAICGGIFAIRTLPAIAGGTVGAVSDAIKNLRK